MNGKERLQACVNLKPVDRPGIMPSYMDRFCAMQAGLNFADIITRPDDAAAAMRSLWRKLDGYGDCPYYASPTDIYQVACKHLTVVKIPGKDLPPDTYWQILEKPIITREDYPRLIEVGWNKFLLEMMPRFWTISDDDMKRYGSTEAYHQAQLNRGLEQYRRDTQNWKEIGAEVFVGASVSPPQMALSLARSLTEYTIDLYEIPDLVERALWAALPDLIDQAINGCKATGIPCVALILERGSAQLYPLSFFERFEWPQLKKMIEALLRENITPLLHMDTDWSKNLPYFKELPKGKIIISLDGTTNMINAKKVLRDHVCLMGDVPASLLVNGTVEEVTDYVSNLCGEVGEGGGFILGTGCSMPPNANLDNVQAMIETCKNFKY